MSKLFSGRFLLTIITGMAFLYLVMSGKMEAKDATMLITMVFTLYFSRNDRKQGV